MFKTRINAIVTRALVDNDFEAAILNGHRREKLHEYKFDSKQIEVVMDIKAANLDQFIHSLGKLIQQPAAIV